LLKFDWTRRLAEIDKDVLPRIIKEQHKSVILVTHDIGEAISMADRIVVLTNRPAAVKAVHDIGLRDVPKDPVAIRTHPEYQTMFSQIWSELEIR
jgi:NitT/TauT family transport system ATP-binding protein